MSKLLGKEVYMKMESFQPVGSFKARGISNLCHLHVNEGKEYIVAASGGNAGYAAAYSARNLGAKCRVFVPKTALKHVIEHIERQDAEVVIDGDNIAESCRAAQEFLKTANGGFVSPFDHPAIWDGHSTIVDEVVHQMKKPDAVIAAVGGGGLMCGLLQGMHRHDWNDVPAYGVETEGAAGFARAMEAGKVVTLKEITTLATSLGAIAVTEKIVEWMPKHELHSIVVSDLDAVDATRQFLDDHRVLVEPSCAAALAALYKYPEHFKDKQRILIIICGGVGVTYQLLKDFHRRVGLE